METAAHFEEVLYFHCGACGTELSVPIAQQGIEGPCPCCGQLLQAPRQEPAGWVFLPPLDRRHDPIAPLANTGWDGEETEEILSPDTMPLEWSSGGRGRSRRGPVPEPEQAVSGWQLPSGLQGGSGKSFQARMAIPESEEPLDDSWQLRHLQQRRRISNFKKLDSAAARILDSTAFRVARVMILVLTGGLCAGLVLYLKDRKWSMEVPWKARQQQQKVDLIQMEPATVRGPAQDQPNPFLTEDPSELEGGSGLFGPSPQAVTFPPASTPIASGGGGR